MPLSTHSTVMCNNIEHWYGFCFIHVHVYCPAAVSYIDKVKKNMFLLCSQCCYFTCFFFLSLRNLYVLIGSPLWNMYVLIGSPLWNLYVFVLGLTIFYKLNNKECTSGTHDILAGTRKYFILQTSYIQKDD